MKNFLDKMKETNNYNFHASLDFNTRKDKASKILELIKPHMKIQGKSILDVGIGSGGIINEISKHIGKGKAVGCDVVDQRQTKNGYAFVRVKDTTLPFSDSSFDIIISNHVIEHVGNRKEQLHHLQEIHRVLKEDGFVYFAVPNRWGLMEPHFNLPFLSWIPFNMRTPYVRALGRGDIYDCLLLSHKDAIDLFRKAGLIYIQKTFDAINVMSFIENEIRGIQKHILRFPNIFFKILYPVIPTMVFLLRKNLSKTI